jgi:hypothetical protein
MGILYGADDGNDANAGTDFASRFRTIQSGATSTRTAPGDTVRFMASRTGSITNCSITNGTAQISLPAGTCKDVATCDGSAGWVASANITASSDTTNKRVTANALSLAVGTSFVTGKMAYIDLGVATDFSAYEVFNAWMYTSSAQSAERIRVDLCSDATGDVPIVSFTVGTSCRATGGLNPTNIYHALVWENGGPLPNNVRSIAIYATSDPGTPTMRFQNFFASKAVIASDCITLNTVVSFTGTIADFWTENGEKPFLVRGVINDILYLDANSPGLFSAIGTVTNNVPPYQGDTKTNQTLYTWLASVMEHQTSTGNGVVQVQESGSLGLPITYSGGWNRTDMSTQDTNGITFVITINGSGRFLVQSTTRSYINFERFGLCRVGNSSSYVNIFRFRYSAFSQMVFLCATLEGDSTAQAGNIAFTDVYIGSGGADQSVIQALLRGIGITFERVFIEYNTRARDLVQLSACKIFSMSIKNTWNNLSSLLIGAITTPDPIPIRDVKLNSPCSGAIKVNSDAPLITGMYNVQGVTAVNFAVTNDSSNAGVFLIKHNGADGDDRIYMSGVTVIRDTTVFDTGTSSWRINITSASWQADAPFTLKVAVIPFAANETKTISLRMRRDNVGLIMRLVAMRQPGLTARVQTEMTAIADTWETVSIVVTSTIAQNMDIFLEAYGGTTYSGWIDNPTVS